MRARDFIYLFKGSRHRRRRQALKTLRVRGKKKYEELLDGSAAAPGEKSRESKSSTFKGRERAEKKN